MSYSLADYGAMLADPIRGDAYFAALRASVRPGHVVADIGAGPGIFGIYAAVLGARRVFLIEPDQSVEAAVALAEENGVADRVEIIRASSTEITLPERADVIVSDLRGVLPVFGTHLEVARDMRQRHLNAAGTCIPQRDSLHVALMDDAATHARHVHMLSIVPAEIAHTSFDKLLANSWYRTHADRATLITDPTQWLVLDYDAPPASYGASLEVNVTRSGVAHGILCWFDTELVEGIGFSNSPLAPRALYGQAMFPFATPLAVEAGDAATIRVRVVRSTDEHLWGWDLSVSRAGQIAGSARHSSLEGLPLSRASLIRRSTDFVPVRNADADTLFALLDAANGVQTSREIASELRQRLPDRFTSEHDALAFVTRHDSLWR